ncbi:hypothetical protein FS842_009920 [Serendipita sp. 407]|nr:hypothetical protein FS842_009920 [Serendipita sp. 407]
MRVTLALAGLTALLPSALGVTEWGQCGGQSYTGSTTCDSGLTCVYFDAWYSQCQKGTNNVSSSAPTTSSSPNTGTCSGATKFKYFGVNESSAEFGSGKYPGVLGTDYTWPSPSSVDYFVGKGMNFFRIAFAMERISPSGLTGSFDATYLSGLKTIVSYVTSKGAYAALDPHNYLRFNGAVITDTSAFTTWWKNLANEFKSDSHVIFDLNNEPWGISAHIVSRPGSVRHQCLALYMSSDALMFRNFLHRFPRLTFTGAAWWAAGPWWGTYFQSIEPPSGAAISRILPEALLPFV